MDYILVLSALLTILSLVLLAQRLRPSHPYPPGPKGHWLFGNMYQLPSGVRSYLKYVEWQKEFGDLLFFKSFGSSLLIINSYKALHDLMVNKGTLLADRPQTVLATMVVPPNLISGQHDSEVWKNQRRMVEKTLSYASLRPYMAKLENHARDLLLRSYKVPERVLKEIHFTQVQIILDLVYGLDIDSIEHPLVSKYEGIIEKVNGYLDPRASVVNSLPFLKHFPTWLPFMEWKRKALALGAERRKVTGAPTAYTKDLWEKGDARPSLVLSLLDEGITDNHFITESAGVLYGAAVDTTTCAISHWMFRMIEFPEVQAKAQAEVDALIAKEGRILNANDRENLPYVEAMIKEIYRYSIVTPLAIPHKVSRDAVYNGMFLPRGTSVLCNMWGMSRDKEIYGPDADEFKPTRFLKTEDGGPAEGPQMDPRGILFGIGRRRCPGQALADLNVFNTIVTCLSTLDLKRPLDTDTGKEYMPEFKIKGIFAEIIKELPMRIEPRKDAQSTLAVLSERNAA